MPSLTEKFDEILANVFDVKINPLAPRRCYLEPLDDTIWPTYGGITRTALPTYADLNSTPPGLLGSDDVEQP